MNLKYKLKENDYLQMQLYFLKESNDLRKIIIKNLIAWFTFFLIIILILYFSNQKLIVVIFAIASIIVLIVNPIRIKDIYFEKLKEESKTYVNKSNQLISVEFSDNYIFIDSVKKQTKINISEIEKIIETNQHFFIKFILEVIIIPKTEIDNQDFLKKELLNLTKKLNIELENQLNWKW
ncbi:hypothetical protein [Flavobacterium sp. NRK F7]|uniref:hypothetical protein n=1 Tax=Flavobacterium sp. NRK F7 TaxID=2954930 RepID=UPI00209183DB|nr:hypothetical protein [Flavobacterium sp. NRK F7]MCO6164485.1 hypothetical protein [Flavobacterium sp. NRK F7]